MKSISIWECNCCDNHAVANYQDLSEIGIPYCPEQDHGVMTFVEEYIADNKYDAILLRAGKYAENSNKLGGFIFNDKKTRFPNGALIFTSEVPNLEHIELQSGMILQTKNTKYLIIL